MSRIRFVLIGGFLGAGKTTTIARLARSYMQQGLQVGIVTNDQAADLVDTYALRAQGFEVGEVAGACFCCSFNELTAAVEGLRGGRRPDVVLAEPVGSCTDLVATVVQPLLRLHGGSYDVAPYGVILKPSHGRRILGGRPGAGFSPQADYIFRKQLQEADFLIVNRMDELAPEEVERLVELLQKEQPGAPILRVSARTGAGFESLLAMLQQRGAFGQHILELDYDTYAQGEAELGWLNSSLRIAAAEAFSLDGLLLDIVRRLGGALAETNAETAHLKTIGYGEGFHAVANLVSGDGPAELSRPSGRRTTAAEIVINARAAAAPELLRQLMQNAVGDASAAVAAAVEFRQTQSFRPGRPTPTHRFDQPLGSFSD